MSTIQSLFQQAQLAEATYASLTSAIGDQTALGQALDVANKDTFGGSFSPSQATAFVSQWRVVDQYDNSALLGLVGTGFSATVFERHNNGVGTGQYSLAIRGSLDIADFVADTKLIATDGVAVSQLVDLYNYWQSLTHTGAYQAAKLTTQTAASTFLNGLYTLNGANLTAEILNLFTGVNVPTTYDAARAFFVGRGYVVEGGTVYAVESDLSTNIYTATNAATYKLRLGSGILVGQSVSVDGHSLGGHLAMAFSRLFPNATNGVTAVNGLGFKIGDGNVNNLFVALGVLSGTGTSPGFEASKIQNVYGIAGFEFASMNNTVLQQPGGWDGIFIESAGLGVTSGHSAVQMTDSAAVYDLFIRLSAQIRNSTPTAALATLKPLFEAASTQAEASLERVVDALVNLFGLDFPPLTEGKIGNREALYERIALLQTLMKGVSTNNPGAHVDVLTTANAQSLALLASGSTALVYRYALKALNPFAIVGDNALYAIHNDQGQLELYNPAEKTGALTEAWLKDRAALLATKLLANTADVTEILKPEYGVNNRTQYADLASSYTLTLSEVSLPAGSASARQIVFGSDTSEVLEGRSKADALYGDGGADYLRGRLDNDALEGGAGMDVYEYIGRKSFGGELSNDGEDVILDTDGKGVLRYVFEEGGFAGTGLGAKSTSTIIRDASVRTSGTNWQSADGKFSYQRVQNDLIVTIHGDAEGRITLKDFKEGAFGIYLLDEQRTAPQTTRDILGDKRPALFSTEVQMPIYGPSNSPGGEPPIIGYRTETQMLTRLDDIGNFILSSEDDPDAVNFLNDSTGNDAIASGGGNDTINAIGGGADVIDAGAGRDAVKAGAGNDVVEGGADGIATGVVLLPGGGTGFVDLPGGDLIAGGAGDDELYGNVRIALSLAIKNGETDVATNAVGDFISGEAGHDWIVGAQGNDALLGGDGDDILVGGAGHDNLFGDRNHTAPDAEWRITRQVTGDAASGFTYNTLFTGTTIVADGAGGRDVIYGGAGDDWAFGGMGDDFIDGGSGQNVMVGEEGADVIIGGRDNDVLIGDNGSMTPLGQAGGDLLDGGAGNDHVQGDGGDDVLLGGAGDDQLLGGEGNDILIGGTGLDVLQGGAGKDTYVFNRGDGTEIIVDTARDAKDPEASVLVLGDGISQSDIKFRKGSLWVDLGPSNADDPLAGNDQIHFTNFNGDYPNLTAAIGEIRFADGSSMDYAAILAQGFDIDGTAFDDAGGTALIGTSVTDRIRGFAGSDELEGRDGDDGLTGDGGADRLDAGNGNDVLDGGANSDLLAGGMGSDDYRFIRGDGLDTLVEGSLFVPGLSDPVSTDRIVFGEDITRNEVSLLRTGDGHLTVRYGAGDEIRVEGQYSVAGSDVENIIFADGQIITEAELDALEVGVVNGTADADEMFGTAGNDVLNGGAGSDTYALYWGMGDDRIIDTADGQPNTLMLVDGATLDSIKTTRAGDDLLVTLRGGGSATVQGFFADGGAPAWQIASAADGSQSLLDFYVAQSASANAYAVDAMADYKQQLLGEWRAGSQPNLELPAQVYVRSTWSQTTAVWRRYVNALPKPVLVTTTFVNDPVSYSTVHGFGIRQGIRTVSLPLSGNTVYQRFVDPLVVTAESDAALIETQYAAGGHTDAPLSYSFFAGGGGPFGNERTYQTSSGTLINTITESSTEGWVPLTLRNDNQGNFKLNVQRIIDTPVIEQIIAGAGDNNILGALENDGKHVALIDAGAGDDVVTAGRYDFVFGNDGNDRIAGGAYAYGGSGFDMLSDGRFMAGGADDDFLSGGEGETTFHFRSDEAGRDFVQDQNGISLTEFTLRAGFADSLSNLIYGGKYRLGGEASFQFQIALAARFGSNSSDFSGPSTVFNELEVPERGTYRYAVLEQGAGFPRGVPDRLFRGPYSGDGYDTWVYNSIEDMMRDFADLGLRFNPADVHQIPGVADLSDFTADNHAALQPFFESGVLDRDTVELADFKAGIDELNVGFTVPDEYGGVNRVLRLVWGEDKVIDIELPSTTDLIGHGIEEVRYGGGSAYIGDLVGIAQEEGFLGTPFDDYLVGTAGDDRIRGLAGRDYIEGGAGNDVLSGSAGIDEFFFAAGAGSDTILDPDAEDLILFGTNVTPGQIRLGLGSLRLGYGGAGEEIHFEGFNPDDVYGATVFGALQFYDTGTWTLLDELTYGQVLSRGFDIDGTAGDDVLRGTNIHDRFTGGAGNDVLSGGASSDTYFFSAGDGIDTINDAAGAGEINRVVLRDYRESDITGVRQGGYVVLRAGAGDAIRILWNDATGSGVDQIEFAGGAVWDRTALAQLPVEAGNAPPMLANAVADQSATEDSSFSFAVPANTFADPDAGDTLTYSASLADGSALPAWLSFNAATGTFSGTPANGDVGTIGVKVTATDGAEASVADTFDIAVANTNDAPTVANAVAGQRATEDGAFSYTVPATTFADVDAGDTLTYSATRADGSNLPAWLAFDPLTRTFSGTPLNGDVGAVSLRITAADSAGAGVATDFTLDVLNTNDAPVVAQPVADVTAVEGLVFSYTAPADVFADVDAGDVLTLSATLADGGPLPGWLQFDAASRTFSGTPANADVGHVVVRLTATDTQGESISDEFSLQVINVNDAPVVSQSLTDAQATEDTAFSYTVPAGTFIDSDTGDALTLSATQADGAALPGWLQFDAASGVFSGTPANADVGAVTLRVTATDATGHSASDGFALTVANVNDAPAVTAALTDAGAAEDAAFSYQVPANFFADVDADDVLTLSATRADGAALPTWLTFDAAQRVFSGTPGNADVGTVALRVTAADTAGAAVSDEFALSVTNTNDAPVLAQALVNQSATENAGFSYTVPSATFTDVDAGDVLTYSASRLDGAALPAWLAFNATTRAFSGTPPGGAAGEMGLRVAATDAAGAQAVADFRLLVQAGGSGITLTGTPASETLTGTAFNDFIDGRSGNDMVYGLAGNDQLLGSGGADRLYGGEGNDTLDGGAGTDTLEGGVGADVYVFGRGSGREVIADRGQSGEIDTVRLGSAISLNQLKFSGDDGDLTLRIANTADQLTIRDWRSSRYGVEVLQLADGRAFSLRALVGARNDDDADDDRDNNDGNEHDAASGRRQRIAAAAAEHEGIAADRKPQDSVQGIAGAPGSLFSGLGATNGGHRRNDFSALDMQAMLDAMDRFDRESAASADALDGTSSRRVLRGSVEATPAANPGLSQAVLANALMQYHLSGSTDAAPGADTAFFRAMAAQGTGVSLPQGFGAGGFGADAQALREFSGLREGLARLG